MNTLLGALKSKTMWFNTITLLLAVLSLQEVVAILPQEALRYIVIVNGVGNLILRVLTNQPLSGKVK